MTLPTHIGIIMDGNGRWAQKRGLSRVAGHKKGAEVLKRVLIHAQKRKIRVVTLFAFSSENWNRPQREVKSLMDLFRNYLKNDITELVKKNVRVSFIGERERFDTDLQKQMTFLENQTKGFNEFHVVLALSYGSRDDIVHAVRQVAQEVSTGNLKPSDIDVSVFSAHLSTHGLPEPDLIIRTSGEERISNFLLWELAYSEFYFTPVLWPDFDEKVFDDALSAYEKRKRRFGRV